MKVVVDSSDGLAGTADSGRGAGRAASGTDGAEDGGGVSVVSCSAGSAGVGPD